MIEITVEGDDPHLVSVGAAIHRLLETNGVKVTITIEGDFQSVATPAHLGSLDIGTAIINVYPLKELHETATR